MICFIRICPGSKIWHAWINFPSDVSNSYCTRCDCFYRGGPAAFQNLREGSLALGATKAETLIRTVLPMATPAMMTGLILAVAGAGEVAPLMMVGGKIGTFAAN